jgi:hypothetical protein
VLHFTFQLLASLSVSMLVSVANRAIWFRFAGFPELDLSLGIAGSCSTGKRILGTRQSGSIGATQASSREMYSLERASGEVASHEFQGPPVPDAGRHSGRRAGKAGTGVPARLDFQCIDSTAVGKSIDVCWSLPFDGPRV